MLEIHDAKKEYEGREILNIRGIQLEQGIYWLQGKNGSGKTTLLRMIAGLIPFRGDILLQGVSLQQQPLVYRRRISWAEAEPIYPSFIRGGEMIAFYRELRKAEEQQVEYLIGLFGMKQHLGTSIGSYSSGMMKRLSLLLAFVGHAALILLDEPLATLDAEASILLPDLVAEYHRDHGTSFIFSSHQHIKSEGLPVNNTLLVTDQTIHKMA